MKRLAVFASGRGSNFSSILERIQSGNIPAKVVCVISDNPQPPVFSIASSVGIPTHWINRKQFSNGNEYAGFLLSLLAKYETDLVVLAGFLKLMPAPVVNRYKNAMINIHPALLPNFGGQGYFGMKVHEAVLASGVKTTGVTVHFVDERYDTGSIVWQEKVDVRAGDTPESLAHRVLAVEHRIYPMVIKAFCEGRIKHLNGRIEIENE
ncbi:MAG: phosphoribosylglycinamide formyltransferase [Candidatus Neomarinimicrobiota bacterium]